MKTFGGGGQRWGTRPLEGGESLLVALSRGRFWHELSRLGAEISMEELTLEFT